MKSFFYFVSSILVIFVATGAFAADMDGYVCDDEGQRSFTSCIPGFYLSPTENNANIKECKLCSAGNYCTGGTAEPRSCGTIKVIGEDFTFKNLRSAEGSDSENDCYLDVSAGFFIGRDDDTQDLILHRCPAGYFGNGGQIWYTSIDESEEVDAIKAIGCTKCEVGTYSNEKRTVCDVECSAKNFFGEDITLVDPTAEYGWEEFSAGDPSTYVAASLPKCPGTVSEVTVEKAIFRDLRCVDGACMLYGAYDTDSGTISTGTGGSFVCDDGYSFDNPGERIKNALACIDEEGSDICIQNGIVGFKYAELSENDVTPEYEWLGWGQSGTTSLELMSPDNEYAGLCTTSPAGYYQDGTDYVASVCSSEPNVYCPAGSAKPLKCGDDGGQYPVGYVSVTFESGKEGQVATACKDCPSPDELLTRDGEMATYSWLKPNATRHEKPSAGVGDMCAFRIEANLSGETNGKPNGSIINVECALTDNVTDLDNYSDSVDGYKCYLSACQDSADGEECLGSTLSCNAGYYLQSSSNMSYNYQGSSDIVELSAVGNNYICDMSGNERCVWSVGDIQNLSCVPTEAGYYAMADDLVARRCVDVYNDAEGMTIGYYCPNTAMDAPYACYSMPAYIRGGCPNGTTTEVYGITGIDKDSNPDELATSITQCHIVPSEEYEYKDSDGNCYNLVENCNYETIDGNELDARCRDYGGVWVAMGNASESYCDFVDYPATQSECENFQGFTGQWIDGSCDFGGSGDLRINMVDGTLYLAV